MIIKQDFSQDNIDKFKNELNMTDWSFLNQFSDVDSMYNAFMDTIQSLYKKVFPVRTKPVGQSIAIDHRPWITPAIKKSINNKNSLYKT